MTHLLVRLTREPYEAGGYRIPKGWLTVAGIALSQRLPELFRDPDRYDPLRFGPDRDEEKPHSIVGFGGGMHRCWAAAFVYSEMKVIIALLLSRYALSLEDREPQSEPNDIGVLRPKLPCWVRYDRRTS
jgi:sterol 14-demethylase